jgi:hypothetical protein
MRCGHHEKGLSKITVKNYKCYLYFNAFLTAYPDLFTDNTSIASASDVTHVFTGK